MGETVCKLEACFMMEAACMAIVVTMVLALTRAIVGPTVYDRILAVNMFGTKTVLLIGVAGFVSGRPDFLDIALVYALDAFYLHHCGASVFRL